MKDKTLIGTRPPLNEQTRQQIREIMQRLNEDSILEFTPHNTLELIIDRAWCALFPEKVSNVKRKKYHKFPF